MDHNDWRQSHARCLGICLAGDAQAAQPRGQRDALGEDLGVVTRLGFALVQTWYRFRNNRQFTAPSDFSGSCAGYGYTGARSPTAAF